MSTRDSVSSLQPHGSDAAKRSADDARLDPNAEQAAKRKRPQSCDTCRSRKIKCVRLELDTADPSADTRCVQCRAIDAKCTFDYIPKRPGPQSSFAKTARKEAEAQAKAQRRPATVQAHPTPPASHSRPSTASYGQASGSHMRGPSPQVPQPGATSGSPSDDAWYRTLAQQNFAPGTGSGSQTRSSSYSGSTNFDAYLNNQMLAMTPSHFAGIPSTSPFDFSPHNIGALSGPSPAMSLSNASSATPGSYAGSSSWHAPARSEASSSRSGLPLATLAPTPQPHQQVRLHTQAQQDQPQPQQQLQPSSLEQHDQVHAFAMGTGMADNDSRAEQLPLPIPSFSRVQSPVHTTEPLPQANEHPQSHSQPQSSQPRHTQMSFGADTDATAPQNPESRSKGGPSLSTMYCGPVLRPKSLEDIAPRQTFLSIISLYFHYLWPLLPIVDRPSFSHDLVNRRDERDEVFLAFVLSLTSYTLIQCPRTVIPAPWTVYRRLHRICHLTSRRMQTRSYDPPQLLHVSTLYCDHIYLGTVGKVNAGNAVLAEAVRVAYTLNLHDEHRNDSTRKVAPYGLDASSFAYNRAPAANVVERELRKRVFWVLHGSSTTIALLQDEPALIHAMDVCVDLPLAVDEDALASLTHTQRSPSGVLCGFLTVTRFYQVMLEVLESYRRDRRFPIDDLGVARSRIRYLADVLRRVQQAIDDMPAELRKPVYTHAPPQPVRRRGDIVLSLDSIVAPGQQQQQQQQHQAPLLQAIGFDADTQTALGNHLSGTSLWPWPAETFTRQGLPNTDARSSTNSSAAHSPHASGEANQSDNAAIAGGQPTHQVLTPPTMTPQLNQASANLTMMDLVNIFRPSPPPASSPVLSPMCTMHANIVATESLIRFLVIEYREMVMQRIADLKLRQTTSSHAINAPEDVERQGWHEAAQNMLREFNSLPLDALASNGNSLTDKIVYVVSALLSRMGRREMGGGLGWEYMSSLLATLTRLSRGRKDQDDERGSAGEGAEGGGAQDDDDRRGGSGGGGGPSGGAGGGDGGFGRGTDGNGHGSNNPNRGAPGRGDSSRRDGSANASAGGGSRSGAGGARSCAPGTVTGNHQRSSLDMLRDSPISPYSSHDTSSSSSSSASLQSSAANTATTTPTSELPASTFYKPPTTNTNMMHTCPPNTLISTAAIHHVHA